MTDGEVVVRERGSVTAIESSVLDDDISIDLDHPNGPHVGVPADSWVAYEGDVDLDDVDVPEDIETDGGVVANRVSMRQYGLGLEGESRTAAVATMALAYAASGYLWAHSQEVAGLVAFGAAVLISYLLLLWERGDAYE